MFKKIKKEDKLFLIIGAGRDIQIFMDKVY